MRALEFTSIPLYHGTGIKQGLSIMAEGYLQGSKTPNDQAVGISTTRDKNLWFHGVDKDAAQILFVFNRARLQTRYKVLPFDYFNPDVYLLGGKYRRRESEEIIVAERLPLSFVSHIIVDDSIWMQEKEELESLAQMNHIKIEYVDRSIREDKDDTLELPDLKVGDEIKIGRWKNRKAIIKGFKKDKNNHPIMKTNKGDHQVFKARISKLMPEKDLTEAKIFKLNFDNTYEIRSTNVYKNPTRREFLILLQKSGELRGLSDIEGNLYVWFADDAVHYQVQDELSDVNFDDSLYFSVDDNDPPDDRPLKNVNGIFFVSDNETFFHRSLDSKFLHRVLGVNKLTEAKIIKIEDPGSYRDDYIVYKNPTPREVKQLLDRHAELRGFDDVDGNIFVWKAYEATHTDAKHELNERHWDLDFIFSTTDEIDDGDWGGLYKVGNYFYKDDRGKKLADVKNKFLIKIFKYLQAQGS